MEFKGFSRVLTSDAGEATTPSMAVEKGITPSVGFLRDDGWSLGAPEYLKQSAYDLWEGSWTHFIRKGDTHWRPIKEYVND